VLINQTLTCHQNQLGAGRRNLYIQRGMVASESHRDIMRLGKDAALMVASATTHHVIGSLSTRLSARHPPEQCWHSVEQSDG